MSVPANVEQMLACRRHVVLQERERPTVLFRLCDRQVRSARRSAGRDLILKSVKDRTGVIKKNAGASLIDIGDGVACLEFHSKMNAIGGDTLQMLKFALGEVEKNFVGLVVGNQGANFCVGANIMLMLMEAQEENWEELDMMARVFQNVDDEFALLAEAGRGRAVSDGVWRWLRNGAACRSRASGGGNLHRSG